MTETPIDFGHPDQGGLNAASLDAFHLSLRDARLVAAATEQVETVSYRIGGGVVTVHLVGSGLPDVFRPPMAHLEMPHPVDGDLTITAFSGCSSDIDVNLYLRSIVQQSGPWHLDSRYALLGLQSSDLNATFQWPVVSLHDPVSSHAVWFVDDLELLRTWDVAAPGRSILHWWLNSRDIHLVHAAAVGTENGAALLTGRGGSGKSTFALSCVGSNLRYLGDDYVAIGLEPEPTVYSMYNSGKLVDREDVERQPHFEPWIVNPQELGDMKQLVYVDQMEPSSPLGSAPLTAIVMPRVDVDARPSISETSPNEALRALAPTSLLQLPGAGAGSLKRMAELVRTVPCFQITCGTDLVANRELLAEHLASLD